MGIEDRCGTCGHEWHGLACIQEWFDWSGHHHCPCVSSWRDEQAA